MNVNVRNPALRINECLLKIADGPLLFIIEPDDLAVARLIAESVLVHINLTVLTPSVESELDACCQSLGCNPNHL